MDDPVSRLNTRWLSTQAIASFVCYWVKTVSVAETHAHTNMDDPIAIAAAANLPQRQVD